MIEILALRARTLRFEHYVRIGQTLVFEYTHCNSGIRILSVYSDHTFEHLQCTSHVRLRSILSCQAIEKISEFDRGIRDEKMYISCLSTKILLLKDLILGCFLSFFVPVFESTRRECSSICIRAREYLVILFYHELTMTTYQY